MQRDPTFFLGPRVPEDFEKAIKQESKALGKTKGGVTDTPPRQESKKYREKEKEGHRDPKLEGTSKTR